MENIITIEEAYRAMYIYLERLYEMTGSDDLAGFLGAMSTLQDGRPADEAIWSDWLKAVNTAKSDSRVDLEFKKL